MGRPITSDVKRAETMALNTQVNKEVFKAFRDYLAYYAYPMNVMLETFMRQYTNEKFHLSEDDILKWKGGYYETEALNTTFNKEIYLNFKYKCKRDGYFVKHVITAFMEKLASGDYVLEYVETNDRLK